CDAPKPATKPAEPAAAPVQNLWAQSGFKVAGLKDGEWKCGTCDLKNPKEATKCTVCDAQKPAARSDTAPNAKKAASEVDASQLPKFGFELDVSKKPAAPSWSQGGFDIPQLKDGEWRCSLCGLTNPKSASRCTVCDTPK
ncbi:hypothetical protein GQ54DRAFT_313574, partial [Martensiomyces pterosporus]